MRKFAVVIIAMGVILIALGVVLFVSAMPVFTFTHTTTQTVNLPPLQKSETVMNYAFDLQWPTQQKEVQVQLTTAQTLNIIGTGNKVFTFKIVKHQPDSIDAIFLSLGKSTSINYGWTPPQSDTYSLVFHTADVGSQYDVRINANVNKTWTVAQTRTDTITVTEQKPLVDFGSDFKYAPHGIVAVGVVLLSSGVIYDRRHRTRTDVQGTKENVEPNAQHSLT